LLNNLESLGELYDNQQKYDKALEYYQQALQVLSPHFITKELFSNPSEDSIFISPLSLTVLKSKSNCLKKLYGQKPDIKYLDAAIQTSQLAIEVIEELRNTYQSYESKMQIAEHEYSIFKLSNSLLRTAYAVTGDEKYSRQAFIVSEKSKSAVLLSSLREMSAREFGGIPDTLLNKEQTLSKLISLYKNNIYDENQSTDPDQNKLKMWKGYLFDAEQKHMNLIELFESNYPKYYALKYDNAVISSRELQKNLPLNTTVIEYILDDSTLNAFIITKKQFTYRYRKIDSSFYSLLNEYLDEFHKFDFSRQSYNDYIQFCWNSKLLYDILIKPMLTEIRGKNLIIIPDGALSYLPFETLIKHMPDNQSSNYYRALEYVLTDFTISYVYSSTLLSQVNNEKNRITNSRLLAFAPEYSPEFNVNNFRTHFVTRQKYRKELYPIPGVIDEVNSIKKLIPGDVFTGNEATESNFKRIAENYDILHLAMHAVIDNNNPLYSKLIFTLENDSVEDGLLNTYEIYGLKLKARMVVLSACNTGEGDYTKGEGVISLARGFVYAGSPSLIMTLWEVEDKSGGEIMKWFYENLTHGESKAEALRNAKIRYLHEARPENIHPFFWSSFVVMGNAQPLYKQRTIYIPICIGILLLGTALFFWFKKIRKSRKIRSS
jgi:CHAT domain-containing protein